jgi:O-acetylhomoserine/O-acetylserine sulfhydrylase-like pyridoxal-dependent enzyme
MINFETIDNERHQKFLKKVTLCKPWVSLGDTQSLVIGQGGHNRIRMSVGLEAISDIMYDLDQALA